MEVGMQNEFHYAIERPSLEDVLVEELKQHESQSLFELLRDKLYEQSNDSRRLAEAIITEIQFRFEQMTAKATPAFE